MKVSIITATYNSEETIEMCLDSVLNQSYDNIEYVIIDGGSTDKTVSIVQSKVDKYANINFISEPDKGIYDALNKGISYAKGEIIGFVHSDDFLASYNIIEDIVSTFLVEGADGVYGNLHYISYDNPDKVVRNWVSKPFKHNMLKRGWMPAHPTLYLKKELYNNYGDFNLYYKIAADYDYILRIFKNKDLQFYFLNKTFVKMRVGGVSNRNLKNIIKKTKEDYRAVKTNNVGGWLTILLKNITKLKQFLA